MAATVIFLTTTPGSNAIWTSPADWNNSDNTVELIGAGASGAASRGNQGAQEVSGGGGGAYSKITNFSVATPGTSQVTYRVGAGGASIVQSGNGNTAGNNGGATWWNSTTDPGAGTDNTKAGAQGGTAGATGTTGANGGAGGASTSGWGQTRRSGGRGGNATGSGCASGGGGAAGPSADGTQGTDQSGTASAGGQGDGTSGGTGTAGNSGTGARTSSGGNPGAEFNNGVTTAGAGGGSGGARSTDGNAATSGSGGAAGAGTGGAVCDTGTATSGKGGDGLIVITYTPVVASEHAGAGGGFVGAGATGEASWVFSALFGLLLVLFAVPAAAQVVLWSQPPHEANPWPARSRQMIVASAVAQAADLGTTLYGTGRGVLEANPVLRPFQDRPLAMSAVKVGVTTASTWALWQLHREHPKAVFWIALEQTVLFTTVTALNARAIRRQ